MVLNLSNDNFSGHHLTEGQPSRSRKSSASSTRSRNNSSKSDVHNNFFGSATSSPARSRQSSGKYAARDSVAALQSRGLVKNTPITTPIVPRLDLNYLAKAPSSISGLLNKGLVISSSDPNQ